jgi:transcriptional repressor NrdR
VFVLRGQALDKYARQTFQKIVRENRRMKCPYCGSDGVRTLETRDSQNNTIRRRKECLNCGKRFTTYEYIETVELMVRKTDGRLERFDLNKIVRGLQKACEKRPVTMVQIRNLAERVRQDLMMRGKEEIFSNEIGDLVMKYLKNLDRVAYVRFASVYKRFEEPEDFRRILKEVRK